MKDRRDDECWETGNWQQIGDIALRLKEKDRQRANAPVLTQPQRRKPGMSEIQFSYEATDYLGLLAEMFSAGHQAVKDFQTRNKSDCGTSGFAYVVIDDQRAAYDLNGKACFQRINGIGVCHPVSCGGWQSLHGAEYVAEAMVEALAFNGVQAHVHGRAD